MNDYYVYLHVDIEGQVRYVGSGRRYRAFDRGNRSKKWKEIFNLFPEVRFEAKNLSLQEARKLEQEAINKYASKNLINSYKVPTSFELTIDTIKQVVYYDETSPSCLKYAVGNNGTGRNKRYAGDCITSINRSRTKNYWCLKIGKNTALAHRLVLILHGIPIPDHCVVNHKDGNSLNNKISNLEIATVAENARRKVLKNKTGHVNIDMNVRQGIIRGYVVKGSSYGGKNFYFSVKKYRTPEQALSAAIQYKLDSKWID